MTAPPLNYNATSAALTELKKQPETIWLHEVSCVPTQQALRHLQTAFKNFYDKRSGYPSFKKKHGKQSAEYTRSAFKYDAHTQMLTVSGLGKLKVRWSRPFHSAPTTITITKDGARRYFVTLCLDESFEPLPKTGEGIGIDLGINRLATLSNGQRLANPRYTAKYQKRLAHEQRLLVRKQKGSNRRGKQKRRVARLHAKIADCREDVLHKFTTDMVRRFDLICLEDLNVRGMVRNHCLAKALSDASFRRGALNVGVQMRALWQNSGGGRPFLSQFQDVQRVWLDCREVAFGRARMDVPGVQYNTRPRLERGAEYLCGRADRIQCSWRVGQT